MKLFSWIRGGVANQTTSLAAYFQDTVIHVANPTRRHSSDPVRILSADFKTADIAAGIMMLHGMRRAERYRAEGDLGYTNEDGIKDLLDHKRRLMGLPIQNLFYKKGDAERLWPGLTIRPITPPARPPQPEHHRHSLQ